jgi:hypothetical protein
MESHDREPAEQPRTDGKPCPLPRTQVESPQAFYKRFTQREDVRRLLQKLARR